MKGDIINGSKNYFIISFFMGLVIIILSLVLNAEIFKSAMMFGIVSGIGICLLSTIELIKIFYVKECPLCGSKIDLASGKCVNCGYFLKKKV